MREECTQSFEYLHDLQHQKLSSWNALRMYAKQGRRDIEAGEEGGCF